MNNSKSNYQTYILFFLWTIGLISIVIRLFINIELTQYILAVALMDIVFQLKRKNEKFNRVSYQVLSVILIFYAWMIITNAYSPSMVYKFDKSLFFVANVIYFIYPFFIKKINFDLLIRLYCFIVLPLSTYFVYMNSIVWKISSASTELFMNIRGSYLVFGIQLGILFLLLLYFKKHILLKVLTLSLLIASSARGPLIFMLLVILIYAVSENKMKIPHPKNLVKSIFGFAGLFVVYYFNQDRFNSILESSFSRFGSLFAGEDGSTLERVHRLNFAFKQPFEKLSTFIFGNGNGSFGILFAKMDKRSYPHNILLECFFEYGTIGLIIFLLMFITIFRKVSFKENVFGLLFIFTFMNAMKSSNITDLWILFGTMGGIVSLNGIDLKKDNGLEHNT